MAQFFCVRKFKCCKINVTEKRKVIDNDLYLPTSLRADFIDCSKWVEEAICCTHTNLPKAKSEFEKLQQTSMRICVTRDFSEIRERAAEIDADHPEWKYGMLISNFADKSNDVSSRNYGPWFNGGCKELTKTCSVYGNQGL